MVFRLISWERNVDFLNQLQSVDEQKQNKDGKAYTKPPPPPLKYAPPTFRRKSC